MPYLPYGYEHLSCHINGNDKSVAILTGLNLHLAKYFTASKSRSFRLSTHFISCPLVCKDSASSRLYIHKLPLFSVEWPAIGKNLCLFDGHLLLAQEATKGKITVRSTFNFCASPLSFPSEDQSNLQSNILWINPCHLHLWVIKSNADIERNADKYKLMAHSIPEKTPTHDDHFMYHEKNEIIICCVGHCLKQEGLSESWQG